MIQNVFFLLYIYSEWASHRASVGEEMISRVDRILHSNQLRYTIACFLTHVVCFALSWHPLIQDFTLYNRSSSLWPSSVIFIISCSGGHKTVSFDCITQNARKNKSSYIITLCPCLSCTAKEQNKHYEPVGAHLDAQTLSKREIVIRYHVTFMYLEKLSNTMNWWQ